MAFCVKCGNKLEEGINFCTQCGEKILTPQQNGNTLVQGSESQTQNIAIDAQIDTIGQSLPKKKISIRKKIIIIALSLVGIIAILGISYWLYTKESPFALIKPKKIELDKYNNIILNQKRNYDQSQKDSLVLMLKDVKNVLDYIRKYFPLFDFEENGYITDDYQNELLINDFNNNPEYAHIYMDGIKEMAGYSQVYTHFTIFDDDEDNEKELFSYYFSIDEEYSDYSGMEYSNEFNWTSIDSSLYLRKRKFSDTNNYYWEIVWYYDISDKDRKTMLDTFLRRIRYTKVFENIDLEWFKDIYTGISRSQKIKDIVEW